MQTTQIEESLIVSCENGTIPVSQRSLSQAHWKWYHALSDSFEFIGAINKSIYLCESTYLDFLPSFHSNCVHFLYRFEICQDVELLVLVENRQIFLSRLYLLPVEGDSIEMTSNWRDCL